MVSALIRSPDSVFGACLKGAFWSAGCLGVPIAVPSEIMIFQGARSTVEFWRDNLGLSIAMLGLIVIGGAFGAARAVRYRMAYDALRGR